MKRRMDAGRTDLALELAEGFEEMEVEKGVLMKVEFSKNQKLKKTIIRIINEEGEKLLKKGKGLYITIEGANLADPDPSYHQDASEFLHSCLQEILKDYGHVLVIGLGNEDVTADALGPFVVGNLSVNRHLILENLTNHAAKMMSAFSPGVMAQTGMETADMVKAIAEKLKPDALVVVDALAARSAERLNRTIQVCDTGITPGSGVGNHRMGITKETMGMDVIAIGVPTVISVPTLVEDAFSFLQEEDIKLLEKYMTPEMEEMYVTPKNVDEAVKKISYTISEAINGCIGEPFFA